MLCFLVVKSFIAANGDQLRISFIILQIIHFFIHKLVKFQLYLGTGGGGGLFPVAPVLNSASYRKMLKYDYKG